ncbi:Alpha/Beta hydrolase protein [Dipodascopsis uninucleata]
MLAGFKEFFVSVEQNVDIYGGIKGSGPGLLLAHGFPENHRIWHAVADTLAEMYTVVVVDLRGYGKSSKPPSDASHSVYSKRELAKDCVKVMSYHGIDKFYFIGHDRGARVGHRLCLDYSDKVIKAIFLDICPTLSMYESTDLKFAKAYYHWFFLIQPAPYPENLIGSNPKAFIHGHMGGRYAGLKPFRQEDLSDYIEIIGQSKAVHAMCEDYRASATIDLEHDSEELKNGVKIKAPLMVLWGKYGVIEKCYNAIEVWKNYAVDVSGEAVESGHYIPEEVPQLLLEKISGFF